MIAKKPVLTLRLLTPLIAALLSLGGCGSEADVGGVTASEADALNRAAATLDAQSAQARQADAALNPAARTARDRRAAERSDAP